MTKEEYDFLCKECEYKENGSYQAALSLHMKMDRIPEEYQKDIKILIASVFSNDDIQPPQYYCDNDCRFVHYFCKGECFLSKDSKTLCPYFSDESFI